MKVIKKENLEFVNGYLVDKEGNVYNDSRVVESAEIFAKTVELLDFIEENEDAINMVGKTISFDMPKKHKNGVGVECNTPALDAKAEEVLKCMEELACVANADRVNEFIESKLQPLVDFVVNDQFVWTEPFATTEEYWFDPTKITTEDLENFAKKFASYADLIDKVEINR